MTVRFRIEYALDNGIQVYEYNQDLSNVCNDEQALKEFEKWKTSWFNNMTTGRITGVAHLVKITKIQLI
ncbi:MAG: hypothetical protein Q7K16_00255 [Candidatus Azambacteria bacterium]|nr:hypothetical protein [Candidatus Azambacteria bacterium]